MFTDATGEPIQAGTFLVYTTKTEAPSLSFGIVISVKAEPSRYQNGTPTITTKIQITDAFGVPENKTRFMVDPATNQYAWMDTGKPNTTILKDMGDKTRRMFVTTPK